MNGLTLRALKGSALSSAELDDGLAAVKLLQASHGLDAGDLVYPDSGSTWAKAIATAAATVAAGCVVGTDGTDIAYIATKAGTPISLPSHGLGSAGSLVYLSQSTAGGAGARPATGIIQPALYIVNASLVLWVGNPAYFQEV